jgi:hypothetical protein
MLEKSERGLRVYCILAVNLCKTSRGKGRELQALREPGLNWNRYSRLYSSQLEAALLCRRPPKRRKVSPTNYDQHRF